MNKTNLPNILFFKTETTGNPLGYSYVTIAKDQIAIQAGDYLEYDIFIDLVSPLSQAGLDMHFKYRDKHDSHNGNGNHDFQQRKAFIIQRSRIPDKVSCWGEMVLSKKKPGNVFHLLCE